ncbi:uncharacterized protein CPUR_08840 [Claviceps purpurea 20.1]|uniref:Uncharacterized protein n=1 Tax=Claviceps purpurea (strain 20.1) TaxID=1111077 RepID=M1W6W3_CLAP2|nr:uncharacterized protein CPUR_08840 [Claviceps purpurea 20.1]
MTQQYGDAVGE